MPSFGVCGPAYQSRSRNVTSDRLLNMYTEPVPSSIDASQGAGRALYGRPGLLDFLTLGDSPNRGIQPTTIPIDLSNPSKANAGWWVVSGGTVYLVQLDGARSIGSVARHDFPGLPAFPVQIFVTGDASAILVSYGKLYNATLSPDSVVEVTDLPTSFVTSYTALDGRGIISGVNDQGQRSAAFWYSNINQLTTFDPLNFAYKEGNVDQIMGLAAYYSYLYLFGSQTTEFWNTTVSTDNPFARMAAGAIVETGLAIGEMPITTVCRMDNTVIFLAENRDGGGVVMEFRGLSPVRVSNYALESAMRNYKTAAAMAYTFQEGGHYFYVLTFALDNVTWVYDSTTGDWAEWNYWDGSQFQAFLARYHGYNAPIHLVGDYRSGKLYQMSTDYLDDAGAPIRRIRVCPHISVEKKWVQYHQLQIDLQQGEQIPAGSTPTFQLQISNDGGWTYGPAQDLVMGQLGQYAYRCIARRLGRSRDRVFWLENSQAIPQAWVDGYVTYEMGNGS